MADVTLPENDRLLLFGCGLFETLLVTAKGIPLLEEHWQRMAVGAGELRLALPGFAEWSGRIKTFLNEGPAVETPFALRVTLSGGASLSDHGPRLFLQTRPFPYTTSQYEQGVRLHILTTPRNEHSPLVGIKSTNYLENILAKEEAWRYNAEEGVWFNSQGYLMEGAMSNIFFVRKGTLFTPALSCGCLPGTRRAFVLKIAAALQKNVREDAFFKDDLFQAEEIFLTNALMGIMPVCQVNDHVLAIAPSGASLTNLLMQKVNEAMPYTRVMGNA